MQPQTEVKMEIREAEKRAAELRAVIEKHNHNYYDMDSPTIEDDEYDALMRELRRRKRRTQRSKKRKRIINGCQGRAITFLISKS